jgi:AcrR family transcriptional regulator
MRVSTAGTPAGGAARLEAPQRLLEAAGEVFAEQGFRAATVREICRRARANIAAVNYYFRDKEGLYVAALEYAHARAAEEYPPAPAARDATAEERLRAFVSSMLARISDDPPVAWHGKLMSREMMQPSRALDALVDKRIRPLFRQLEAIVREVLGRRADDGLVRRCAFSIVGQCFHYHHARPLIVRLSPRQRFRAADMERLADHITRFSMGALRALARPRDGGPA